MAELGKHKSVRYIQVQRGSGRLVLHNAAGIRREYANGESVS
jgi:hypothetical protein